MHIRTTIITLLSAVLAGAPAATLAAPVTITDANPQLIFDDNNPVDGQTEWVVTGSNEQFIIQDFADAQKIVFGVNAASDSVNIGYNSASNGAQNIALGISAKADGNNSVALGRAAHSLGDWSMALGRQSESVGTRSAAIGYTATSGGVDSLAAGSGASSGGLRATAIGYGTQASAPDSLSLGYLTIAAGQYALAAGNTSFAEGDQSAAIGFATHAEGSNSMAAGWNAHAQGNGSLAIGEGASSEGSAATAIGSDAHAVATFSIAVGDAYAGEISDLAVGYLASAYGSDSMAIGAYPIATAPRSGALGFAAISEAQEATALGFRAHAVQPGSIVLGSIAGVNGATSDASIGVGTNNPLAALHVARANGTAAILVQETAAAAAGRTLFTLANRGNTKFELKETGSGTRWQFTNSGDAFRISKFGTGQVEFQVFNNGDAVLLGDLAIGGAFTEMSDRNEKHAIVPLDGEAVLAKVAQVPISEWSYKTESADQRHIGPMAQDFHAAFGLASGDTRISARDMAGVALASIQALAKENRALRTSNQALRDDVETLKALVSQLLPHTAQN